MSVPSRNLIAGVGVLVAVFGIAVVGYVIAGWSWMEAVYMVVITVFSVGYGEVRPVQSPGLVAFTAIVIVVGCRTVIYIMSALIQLLTEVQIRARCGRP